MKKKTINNRWTKLGLLIAITSIIGVVMYPLFDFLWCTFLTNSPFEYSVKNHIIEPITVAVIVSFIIYWPFSKDKKKSKDEE